MSGGEGIGTLKAPYRIKILQCSTILFLQFKTLLDIFLIKIWFVSIGLQCISLLDKIWRATRLAEVEV